MNFFVLKYMILLAAILGSTMVISGPLNPDTVPAAPGTDNGSFSANSIYQFGSDVFYRELDKPGNEYMKAGVEGYSHNLVPSDSDTEQFDANWKEGVTTFKSGYTSCMDAYLQLAAVPSMTGPSEKNAVWEQFHSGQESIAQSEDYFNAAKSYSSATTASGFTIGMIQPKIDQIRQDAEDAEISAMRAILSDRDHDQIGFSNNLTDTGTAINDMKRLYPELKVLSNDF